MICFCTFLSLLPQRVLLARPLEPRAFLTDTLIDPWDLFLNLTLLLNPVLEP